MAALGVEIHCGVDATAAMIRDHRPDHVVVATGARPRPLLLEGAAPLQAWYVIADPSLVPEGARVAIIGGGIVGLEVADMLALRGCRMTVLEALPALAPSMARNNRTDLLLRLRAAGVEFHTKARVQRLAGTRLEFTVDGRATRHRHRCGHRRHRRRRQPGGGAGGRGPGVPFTLIGDANHPGDFLSVLRDASMTGLALGLPSESLPA